MSARRVFLDPDGTADPYLGVIVAASTGVVYVQQCGGHTTLDRELEGYYVPLGRLRFDAEQGYLDLGDLRQAFHDGRGCLGHHPPGGPRLELLRATLGAVVYWRTSGDGTDSREPLLLDEARLGEALEAWVPVLTPDGPGMLTWSNCD